MFIDEEQERLILRSSSLMSKFGFWDGDQFADFVHNNNYHVKWDSDKYDLSFDHEVLKRVVERYLIPALPVPVKLLVFPTHHNPVRVCEHDYDELATQPETEIKITDQQLREICQQVRDERI